MGSMTRTSFFSTGATSVPQTQIYKQKYCLKQCRWQTMFSGFNQSFRVGPQAPISLHPSERLVPGSVLDGGGRKGTSVTFFCRGDGVGLFSVLSASLSLLLPSVLVAVAVAAVVAAVATLVMLAPLA